MSNLKEVEEALKTGVYKPKRRFFVKGHDPQKQLDDLDAALTDETHERAYKVIIDE